MKELRREMVRQKSYYKNAFDRFEETRKDRDYKKKMSTLENYTKASTVYHKALKKYIAEQEAAWDKVTRWERVKAFLRGR